MNIGYTNKAKTFELASRIVQRSRPWHKQLQDKHQLHPAVQHAFRLGDPLDWQRLLLEWPHVATTDVTRVAYTRDERAGIEDKQAMPPSLGKYLKRHWPTMPDHIIRDMVARYATAAEFRIEHTTEAIVKAVQEGPPSCMQFIDDDGDERLDELGHHPYETYAPRFGWHVATRWLGNSIVGRALLMQRDNDATKRKYFVRTYRRGDGESYSQPDDELMQWLQEQGYEHRSSWYGERLAYLPLGNYNFIAPYIDGGAQDVDVDTEYKVLTGNRTKSLIITDRGEYGCTHQDGTAYEQDSCTCDACGMRVSEDDTRSVGFHGDTTVGDCCIDDYTYVTGRGGDHYYISGDDAVEVNSNYYDPDYLEDNGIVVLHDGDYASMDDAVLVESQSEYYLIDDCVCLSNGGYEVAQECVQLPNGDWELDDDCVVLHDGEYALKEDAVELHNGDYALTDDVVQLHDGDWALEDDVVQLHDGDWALEDDAWQCAGSGNWYLTADDTPVEVDGETYHEDNVPETDEETTTETETTKEASC